MDIWCENILQVHGAKAARNSFKRKAQEVGTALSAIKLHNKPDDVHEEVWMLAHFDLPEDIDARLYETQCTLVYRFSTHNVPPFKWLKHLSSEYPALCFDLDVLIEDADEEYGYLFKKVHIQNGKMEDVVKYSNRFDWERG